MPEPGDDGVSPTKAMRCRKPESLPRAGHGGCLSRDARADMTRTGWLRRRDCGLGRAVETWLGGRDPGAAAARGDMTRTGFQYSSHVSLCAAKPEPRRSKQRAERLGATVRVLNHARLNGPRLGACRWLRRAPTSTLLGACR